jgi:hypothetical protein
MQYSDYILAAKPWSFCHFDTGGGSSVFLDRTGQKHHCIPNQLQHVITDNVIESSLVGDIPSYGARIHDNQILLYRPILKFDHNPILGLRIDIPVMYSDTVIYRRHRQRIQNPLAIRSCWYDLVYSDFNPNYQYSGNLFSPLLGYQNQKLTFDEDVVTELYYPSFSHSYSGESTHCSLDTDVSFEFFELQAQLGPFHYVTKTQTIVNSDDVDYKQSLYLQVYDDSGVLLFDWLIKQRERIGGDYEETLNIVSTIKKLTFGVFFISTTIMKFVVYHNDTLASEVELSTQEDSITAYTKLQLVGTQSVYHSLAVFFNSNITDAWVKTSYQVLSTPTDLKFYETTPTRFSGDSSSLIPIENLVNSLNRFMDTVLILGSHHCLVKQYEWISQSPTTLQYYVLLDHCVPPLDEDDIDGTIVKVFGNQQGLLCGILTVISVNSPHSFTCTISPTSEIGLKISTPHGEYDCTNVTAISGTLLITTTTPHNFRPNDNITCLAGSSIEKNYLWSINNRTNEGFEVLFDVVDNVDNVEYAFWVAKKAPLGGIGSWTKEFHGGLHCFSGRYHNIEERLCIEDTSPSYVFVKKSNSDYTEFSETAYFIKFDKLIMLSKETASRVDVFGDGYRCYFFIASKQPSVSHTSLLMYGEIEDFFTPEQFKVILIAQNDSTSKDCHFNTAHSYDQWEIMPTGHLMCTSSTDNQNSDIQWDVDGAIIDNRLDGGWHVYPDFTIFDSFLSCFYHGYSFEITIT